MTLYHATLLLWCLGLAPGQRDAAEYPFFSQSTVAAHDASFHHSLPCIALLEDERLMLVWSRYAPSSTDFAVVGAFSSDGGCSWTPPQSLIDHPGLLDADANIVVVGSRVLVTCTTVDFSQGIRTSTTWCIRSEDNGGTWTSPYEIPMGHTYTCGKCQRAIRLQSGELLMGYSWDVLCEQGRAHQSEGEMDLRAGVMRSLDQGLTWTAGGDTHATYEKIVDGAVWGTDEPAVVECDDRSVYMLMRTGSTHLYEARSSDGGKTWQAIQPSPLRGTNAPAALTRFVQAGRSGVLVVWDNARERFPLCAAVSWDGCRTWSAPRDIGFPYTGGQASYPSCVQTTDGALIAVWQQDVTGGRDIRLARFSPAWLSDVSATATSKESSLRILLLGDSTTAARGPLRIYAQLLEEDLAQRGIAATIINAGIGGESTSAAKERLERELKTHQPDIVTFLYGINDAAVDVWRGETAPRVSVDDYRRNLESFVHLTRTAGARPVLLTPNPLAWTPQERRLYGKPPYDPNEADGHNVVLKAYVAAVRDVAAAQNVPLVDVYQAFEKYSREHALRDLLLDGAHPNERGHRIIADELWKMGLVGPPNH